LLWYLNHGLSFGVVVLCFIETYFLKTIGTLATTATRLATTHNGGLGHWLGYGLFNGAHRARGFLQNGHPTAILGQAIGLQGLESKNTLHDFHAVPFDGLPLVFDLHFVVIPFHPVL
jgi:hypothetical protein